MTGEADTFAWCSVMWAHADKRTKTKIKPSTPLAFFILPFLSSVRFVLLLEGG